MILKFMPFIFLLCLSCGTKKVASINELNAYLLNPENGVMKQVEKYNTTLELIYRPKEFVLLQEAGQDRESLSELKQRIDSLDYFVLRISKEGKEIENTFISDPGRYNRAISYLYEGISSDIHLLANGQKILPELTVFTQSFGSTGASSVLLVFKSYLTKCGGCTATIIFNDSVLGVGRTEFVFDVDAIKKIPMIML